MLYDDSTSRQRKSRELDLLKSTLSGIDESYSWEQVKKLLQERVFPKCEKFGTWSSTRERVDQVPNRKVPLQIEESSVLGPQKSSVSRPSPEQESTTIDSKQFQCLVLEEERVDRALNRKGQEGNLKSSSKAPPLYLQELNSLSSNPANLSSISSQSILLYSLLNS